MSLPSRRLARTGGDEASNLPQSASAFPSITRFGPGRDHSVSANNRGNGDLDGIPQAGPYSLTLETCAGTAPSRDPGIEGRCKWHSQQAAVTQFIQRLEGIDENDTDGQNKKRHREY